MNFKQIIKQLLPITTLILFLLASATFGQKTEESDFGCLYKIDKDGAITVEFDFTIEIIGKLDGQIKFVKKCVIQKGSRLLPLGRDSKNFEHYQFLEGPNGKEPQNECEEYLLQLKEFPIHVKFLRNIFCPRNPEKPNKTTKKIAVARS
ncbi:hypothetical protein KKA15_04530 [Patescibacteria group bacterium]|nr:hypothetical protein [Patescibacteria group bacterium]